MSRQSILNMFGVVSRKQCLAVALFIIVCLIGIRGLSVNASYRVYFDDQHPLLKIEQRINSTYNIEDSLVIIVKSTKDTLLSPINLATLNNIYQSINSHSKVTSLRSFMQFIPGYGDDVDDDDDDDDDETNVQAKTSQDILQHIYMQTGGDYFIDKSGQYGLFVIHTSLPGKDAAKEVLSFVAEIRTAIDSELAKQQGSIETYYTSTLALNESYIKLVRNDLKRFIPALFILFLLCLLAFFRNLSLCIYMLLNALLATITTFGIAGWLTFELAAINAFTPVIIVSLSIAISVHLITGYCRYLAAGLTPEAAIEKSRQFNFKALALSTITTAAGFLLLTLSPSPPIRLVGILVAIGIVISFVFALTLLSFAATKIKISRCQAIRITQRISLQHLWGKISPYQAKILPLLLLLAMASIVTVSRMKINDNVYQYFPASHEFSVGTQLLDRHFSGVATIEYSIESNQVDGIITPAYLSKLQEFTEWLQRQPATVKVQSLSVWLAKKGIFDNRAGRYLQLHKSLSLLTLPVDSRVNADYSASRVTVFMKSMTTKEMLAVNSTIQHWLDGNLTGYTYLGGVSPDLIFAHVNQQNANSMFFSLALALVAVALLSGWLLRSLKVILIALICNLLPLILVFSFWTLIGGYISMGSAIVMGMITGIIIDDTLHTLIKFNQHEKSDSVERLYSTVSPAILITSVTLCIGLLTGLLSDFRPIVELSGLSAAIIFVALLVDILCLPALLNHFLKKTKG